jgi:hypothetical protein
LKLLAIYFEYPPGFITTTEWRYEVQNAKVASYP